ncbi:hypothetical protein [Desulfuribacillus stibiiarsenatis]|nr:hypothetical protein [Desulfuribacillus stibiiarsenatis]
MLPIPIAQAAISLLSLAVISLGIVPVAVLNEHVTKQEYSYGIRKMMH